MSFIETYGPLVELAAFLAGWVSTILAGFLIVRVAE